MYFKILTPWIHGIFARDHEMLTDEFAQTPFEVRAERQADQSRTDFQKFAAEKLVRVRRV